MRRGVMKRFTLFAAISLFIFLTLVIYTSCQKADESKPSNPLVGTWKPVGAVDSAGKAIEYFKGETGYHIFLENGTLLTLGFRKSFPQTGVKPSTLEEYEKIAENSWGYIGTYMVDKENQKCNGNYIFNLNPENMGNDFTVNYKVEGDTLTSWTDEGKIYFKSFRVK
jgi:hypothetical protein